MRKFWLSIRDQGLRLSALLAIFLLAHTHSVAGQEPAVVRGTVIDDMTDRPVSGVAVTLEAADGARLDHVFTTEAGHFLLSARRPGALRLRASRIGYEDVVTPPYRVAAGDSVQVILRLNVKAALMPPLEVLVHRRAEDPRLAEFVYRKERGMGGIFIDREDPALFVTSRRKAVR